MILASTLALASTFLAASHPGHLDNYENAMRWVEARLARDPLTDPRYEVAMPSMDMSLLDDDLHAILAKYGPKPRTYAALAKCFDRLCGFSDALGHLSMAEKLRPSSALSQERRRIEERRDAVIRALRLLPNGNSVLSLTRLPGGKGWALVTGYRERFYDIPPYLVQTKGIRLRILTESGRLSTALPSAGIFEDDSFANEATALLKDCDGDGRPELVVWTVAYGGSAAPARVHVLHLGRRIVRIGDVFSSEGLRLKDIDRNGTLEILGTDAIGENYEVFSHASQPRWTDIWSVSRGAYRLANERFPKEFHEETADLDFAATKLGAKPDPEIRFYQAQLLTIQGKHKAAREYLRRAEKDAAKLYRKRMRDWGDDYRARGEEKAEWDDLRRRIAAERRKLAKMR